MVSQVPRLTCHVGRGTRLGCGQWPLVTFTSSAACIIKTGHSTLGSQCEDLKMIYIYSMCAILDLYFSGALFLWKLWSDISPKLDIQFVQFDQIDQNQALVPPQQHNLHQQHNFYPEHNFYQKNNFHQKKITFWLQQFVRPCCCKETRAPVSPYTRRKDCYDCFSIRDETQYLWKLWIGHLIRSKHLM